MKRRNPESAPTKSPAPHDASETAISERRLREFIAAYQNEFNEELSPKEAQVLLSQLIQLYLHVERPLPNDATVSDHGDTPAHA